MKPLFFISTTVLFFWLNISSFAQCDPEITPVDDQQTRYKPRGNRCEGLYSQQISSGDISIVGFTIGELKYKLDESEIIHLSPGINTSNIIKIRSVPLPLNTYYRMDAEINGNATLKWNVKEVLLPERIAPSQISVYGWQNTNNGIVYVPIRAKPVLENVKSDNKIRLILRSSVQVFEAQWRIATLNKEYSKIKDGNFNVGNAIEIILPAEAKGKFVVDFAAKNLHTQQWIKQQFTIQTH